MSLPDFSFTACTLATVGVIVGWITGGQFAERVAGAQRIGAVVGGVLLFFLATSLNLGALELAFMVIGVAGGIALGNSIALNWRPAPFVFAVVFGVICLVAAKILVMLFLGAGVIALLVIVGRAWPTVHSMATTFAQAAGLRLFGSRQAPFTRRMGQYQREFQRRMDAARTANLASDEYEQVEEVLRSSYTNALKKLAQRDYE